jgi:hypothetical protein
MVNQADACLFHFVNARRDCWGGRAAVPYSTFQGQEGNFLQRLKQAPAILLNEPAKA